MSRPGVSDTAERLYARLAAFHGDDEDGGWIMLHLCEALARILQKATDALRYDDIGSGARRMHDPDRAPAWALPFLAQHVGLPALPTGLTEEQQRALIRDAPGLHRGTVAALRAAAQRYLTGSKFVFIAERDGGAYKLTVITRTSETPDSAAVLAALLTQKPAGIVLTHVVADGTTWDEAVSTWDTVDPSLTWDGSLDATI